MPVIEERIQNENGPMEPNETEIHVWWKRTESNNTNLRRDIDRLGGER